MIENVSKQEMCTMLYKPLDFRFQASGEDYLDTSVLLSARWLVLHPCNQHFNNINNSVL